MTARIPFREIQVNLEDVPGLLNMSTSRITFPAIAVLTVLVGVGRGHLLFNYTPQDPQDPSNVSLVRQALTASGISTEGIYIKSFYEKYWVFGSSIKADYVDRTGRICHFHFRTTHFGGIKLTGTPSCDSREIGVGDCAICGRGNVEVDGGVGFGEKDVLEKINVKLIERD